MIWEGCAILTVPHHAAFNNGGGGGSFVTTLSLLGEAQAGTVLRTGS